MYISLSKLKPKPRRHTLRRFFLLTEKTVAKMRFFEIKVVPLQPTRSMVRDRFESKRENGWSNLLKSEISGHKPRIRKNYGQSRKNHQRPSLWGIRKSLKNKFLERVYPISTLSLQLINYQIVTISAWASDFLQRKAYYLQIQLIIRLISSTKNYAHICRFLIFNFDICRLSPILSPICPPK